MRGQPIIVYVENSPPQKIVVRGDMFDYFLGNGLYLSGSNEFNTQYLDLYSRVKNVSAFNPPFSGTPVNFNKINNNTIEFFLPENIVTGNYDIIYCNPAGYVKASSTSFFKGLSTLAIKKIEPVLVDVINTINGENIILSINGNNIVPIKN